MLLTKPGQVRGKKKKKTPSILTIYKLREYTKKVMGFRLFLALEFKLIS